MDRVDAELDFGVILCLKHCDFRLTCAMSHPGAAPDLGQASLQLVISQMVSMVL